ncbi:MAG: hypothetical protein WBW00_07060, partial [Pseudolabrys sp.]
MIGAKAFEDRSAHLLRGQRQCVLGCGVAKSDRVVIGDDGGIDGARIGARRAYFDGRGYAGDGSGVGFHE